MPHATTADGVKLYYEEVGQGTPIVFVHEFADDINGWAAQVKFFARRYRTIAYNARGYPPSDVPADPERYSQALAAEDIKAILDHLKLAKAHVVGLSMGGFATLHFGLMFPERALSLVVGGRRLRQRERRSRDVPPGYRHGGGAVRAGRHGQGRRVLHAGADARAAHGQGPHRLEGILRRFASGSALGHANTMRGVQRRRPSIFELEAKLERLTVPTLIMTGDEDDPCLEPGIFMKRKIATSALVVHPQVRPRHQPRGARPLQPRGARLPHRGRRRTLVAARSGLADRLGHSSRGPHGRPLSAAVRVEPVDVAGDPPVRGALHRVASAAADGLVLTHGAGGNKDAPLLVAVAEAFAARGVSVLRCDLPYPSGATARRPVTGGRRPRPRRPARRAGRAPHEGRGPPVPRRSLVRRPPSLDAPRRQPTLAHALLLQSYPLHPPGRPAALRTAHLPQLQVPTLFVHGITDPFATPAELESARALIPGRTHVLSINGRPRSRMVKASSQLRTSQTNSRCVCST